MNTTRPIDKSTWGPGPWQDEPDRLEWRHAGFPCLAVRNARFGNWCGYVGVPAGHPYHGSPSSTPEMDVHGGLTYGRACHGRIGHVPAPGESDQVWWLGFDCGHADDLSPALVARDRQRYSEDPCSEDVYRDQAYVEAETNRLAEQLRAVQP